MAEPAYPIDIFQLLQGLLHFPGPYADAQYDLRTSLT